MPIKWMKTEPNRRSFVDLEHGDTFISKGDVYIKTQKVQIIGGPEANSYNLSKGGFAMFVTTDDLVEECIVELTLKAPLI